MKKFYKIENGLVIQGSGIKTPDDMIVVGSIEDTIERKEDGSYYEFYNLDYTPDFEKIQTTLEDSLKAIAKAEAKEAIKVITVTTESGLTFYADPESRTDLSDAISIMVDNGITEYLWKTVDGIKQVTLNDMKEARQLGLLEKGKLVGAVA